MQHRDHLPGRPDEEEGVRKDTGPDGSPVTSSPAPADTRRRPRVRVQTGERGSGTSHAPREKRASNTVPTKFTRCLLDA